MASLKGCKTPMKEILLGPNRSCLNPKTFRSKRVTKATLIKIGRIKTIKLTADTTILKLFINRLHHNKIHKV